MTDDEARPRAAKPNDRGGDLLRSTKPTNRLVPHYLLHRIRLARQHGCDHRRFDDPRADGVDADAPGCIFERSALRQPDHPVLRRVIDGSARKAHEPAERGAVDDRATSLGAHLTQLVFHAAPDAAEIGRDGAIEFVAAGVGGLHGRSLHAGIVERRIQPPLTNTALSSMALTCASSATSQRAGLAL